LPAAAQGASAAAELAVESAGRQVVEKPSAGAIRGWIAREPVALSIGSRRTSQFRSAPFD